jgi:TonB family protein
MPDMQSSDVKRTERREHPRHSVRSLAYVELGEGNGGVAINISEGGMAVKSIMSLMGDELPAVRIRLAHSEKDLEVGARVVWSTDLGTFVGIQFIGLSDEARELIREWTLHESTESATETIAPTEEVGLRTVPPSANPSDSIEALPGNARERVLQDQATALVATNAEDPPGRDVEQLRAGLLSANKRPQWAVAALVMLAIVAVGILALRGKTLFGSRELRNEARISSHLDLKLDRTGTDWQLSWNPNAPAVLKATRGRLFVTDGALQKTVELDASDLHGGTIVYSPASADVVWKLEVTDGSAAPISESIRTVSPLPSAMQRTDGSVASQEAMNAQAAEHERKSEGRMKRKAPETQSRSKHSGQNLASSVAVTPTKSSGTSLAAVPSAPLKSPEMDAGVSAKRSDEDSSNQVTRGVHRGGVFEAAQILTKVNPSYPASARQDGIAGTVELHFKIGLDGSAHDISVVRGPSVLAQAAVEAVADRKYRPARIDGVPTATEASSIFDFKLN